MPQRSPLPRRQLGPKLLAKPCPGQRVFIGLTAKREIAGDDYQIRHQPVSDVATDLIGQVVQDGVSVPATVLPKVDVGKVQQADRRGAGRA